MQPASADGLEAAIKSLQKILKAAIRNRYRIDTHPFYGPKTRAGLADFRKQFLLLKRDFPREGFPAIAFQLTSIEPLVSRAVELFPSEPREILKLLEEVEFKVNSDLAAELAPGATGSLSRS